MNTSRLLILCLLLPVGVSFATPARAAPPPVVSPSDRTASDRADELATRALVFANKDQPAAAEPLLREAWKLKHSYDIAANLGILDVALNKWCDAAELLTYALKTFPVNGKPEHKKLLEVTLAKARPQVAALAIKVNVEKAEVFVDGKSVGFAPLVDGLFVEPGTRKIEARLPGYEAATEMVEAMKNGSIEVALTLRKPIPLPPPSDAAPLRLPQEDGPKTGLLVVGGVTAGTALVAGVVFTVMSNGKSSDADSLASSLKGLGAPRPCQSNADACAAIDSKRRAQDVFANGAMGGFITAGALAFGTIGYALFAPRGQRGEESKGAAVRVVPMLTSQQGGVLVMGAW